MDWKFIADYGVALGLLILLLGGIWRVLVWIANHVILPVVASHISFLKTASESLAQQRLLIERTNEQLGSLKELVEQQGEWMRTHEQNMMHVIRSELSIHDDKLRSEGQICPMADSCPMKGEACKRHQP